MGSTYTESNTGTGEREIRGVLTRATTAGCLVMLLVAGVAGAERIQLGNLVMQIGGGFTPTTLPANRNAPINLQGYAHIKTKDGSHPPALTRLTIEYDKHGRCLLYTSPSP